MISSGTSGASSSCLVERIQAFMFADARLRDRCRMVSSSLSDMEARYNKAIEEKTLLEQELIEKIQVEEEMQRLKDEINGTHPSPCPPSARAKLSDALLVSVGFYPSQTSRRKYQSSNSSVSSLLHLQRAPPRLLAFPLLPCARGLVPTSPSLLNRRAINRRSCRPSRSRRESYPCRT